jgi:tetratricopeptide (TPR) repeat protein
MRGKWLFCLCVLLLAQPSEVLLRAQPPDVLLIDNFETEGGWEHRVAEGCTFRMIIDRLNTREGQSSLRMEAEIVEPCGEGKCFAGIARKAPDLGDYAFFRLWLRADTPVNAYFGIYLESSDGNFFHAVPLNDNKWNMVTIPFLEFKTEGDPQKSVVPESIGTISLFLMSEESVTVKVNVDNFVALTDLNSNGVPDGDEAQKIEAAENSREIAEKYFDEGDYEKAGKYYSEAKSLYQQAGDNEKAQEMDAMSKESKAQLDYEKGEELYEQGEHLRAMQAYEEARREFVRLGNADMVDTIEERLEELSELTGKPVSPISERPLPTAAPRERGGGGGLLFVLIVCCLVGVGVYLWKFRGAPEGEEVKKEEEPTQTEPLTASEAKSEKIRELKAKFVYGEINRQEYEKKLRELE